MLLIYKLIGENDYKNPIYTIIKNRDINADTFFNLNSSVINHYSLLNNMDKGINCLLKHIELKNNIFIQVDSDCDGYLSSAILINYLNQAFPGTKVKWRLHDKKDHGASLETIPEDTHLLIIPDAGSNQYALHQELKERGIDTLVLDHHECEKESNAAIIINNQLSNEYQNKRLSGVGIVYKFCKALDDKLGLDLADSFLDLVAIGNIGDVIDLREPETRYYVKKGLKQIKNPLIKEIVGRQSFFLDGNINIHFTAFSIVPFINAAIRYATMEEKTDMMKALLGSQESVYYPRKKIYEPIVKSVARRISNTKNRQKKSLEKPVNVLIEQLIKENKTNDKVIVLDVSDELKSSFTGLVATQLAKKFKRPVMLGRKTKEGKFGGSARGYEKSGIKDFKQLLTETGLFNFCEGHANAFGFEIEAEYFENLSTQLNSIIEADVLLEDVHEVDFIIPAADMDATLIKSIHKYRDDWGSTVEEPLIAIEGIQINNTDVRVYKNRTSTFVINVGEYKLTKPYYKGDFDELFDNGDETFYLDVVGKCKVNKYENKSAPAVEIVDIEVTDSFLF
ncbi:MULTISPECIES: DHH family phosphoesterase [Bacillus amyloliquefaciens group]|uniref:DHH family phosphoesterase n=1 Tax=Bacillus amyloliquefaciens group TaxID=1938374 RepID=UPI001ED8EF19|nr:MULTISPECIES: DHH family phosphoesterase [Bacillus amyloliquefaciens group]MEC0382979.1 DHH family phosphoesterase [Bacillus velezensis]MEC0403135.1 DHH family phosphoesterase [Bacillus velezensis]MEC0967172.1 DHH family phosphoesterase [Bacillus amyloliquefaciens]MEC1832751.1 DHH family phosphoesterase [Bacillus amyloliquefaciens]MEC1836256.1 DHH family phosphoesterase [Bacillus amyloliquefaciens]